MPRKVRCVAAFTVLAGVSLHACYFATMRRGTGLSLEEISAHILRHLIDQAGAALASTADAAVRGQP